MRPSQSQTQSPVPFEYRAFQQDWGDRAHTFRHRTLRGHWRYTSCAIEIRAYLAVCRRRGQLPTIQS